MNKPALNIFTVDRTSAVPLYHQIYQHYRKRILSGELPQGALLPAEHQIIEMLGVSRITVKRAINELAGDGLVHRQRGRGTIVALDTDMDVSGRFTDLVTTVRKWREVTKCEIIFEGEEDLPSELAEHFAPRKLSKAYHIRYRLSFGGKWFSYAKVWLPLKLINGLPELNWSKGPVVGLLRNHGVDLAAARQTISADLAGENGKHLGLEAGAPILRFFSAMMDSQDKTVFLIDSIFPHDIYQYHMHVADYESP